MRRLLRVATVLAGLSATQALAQPAVGSLGPASNTTGTSVTPTSANSSLTLGAAFDQVADLSFYGRTSGETDDTGRIQRAMSTGKPVIMRALTGGGCYLTSSAVTMTGNGQKLLGLNLPCWNTTSSTADILAIGQSNGSALTSYVLVEGVHFWSTVKKTAGAAIVCYFCKEPKFRDIYAGTDEDLTAAGGGTGGKYLYDGVVLHGFFNADLDHLYAIAASHVGLTAAGYTDATSTAYGVGLWLHGGSRINYATYGIWIAGGAGGVYLDQADVLGNGLGLEIDRNLVSAQNQQVFLGPLLTFDTNGGALNVGASALTVLQASGTWFASSTLGPNVTVNSPQANSSYPAQFLWSGVHNVNAQGYKGWSLAAGSNVITGGSTDTNTGGGIYATGGSLIVSGHSINNNGGDGINTTALTFLNINGNIIVSNSGYAINATTAPHTAITGNVAVFNTSGFMPSGYVTDVNHVVANNAQ